MFIDRHGRPAVVPLATAETAAAMVGNRRDFMKATAVVALAAASQRSLAQGFHAADFWERPRYIWMKRPATGEEIRVVYWADGRLIDDAYTKLSWFMRDVQMQHRLERLAASGKPAPAGWFSAIGMSPVLLDILYATNGWLDFFGVSRALVLTSGHRHRVTNGAVEGAARNSLHVHGRAADIVIPGVGSSSIGRYGVWLSAGGVGFYPSRGFTHVDDGRLRTWRS